MFHNIREIEQLASKYTTIYPMKIKDHLQALIDDGLVNVEKCGGTNVYWCFDYDKVKKIKDLINLNQVKVFELKSKVEGLNAGVEKLEAARSSKNRKRDLLKLKKLKKEQEELQYNVKNSDFDPSKLQEIKTNLTKKLEVADICADNIEALIAYFKRTWDVPIEYFQKELGDPEEFFEVANPLNLFKDLKYQR